MKKLLIQPCVLMIIALSTLAYGCTTPGEEVAKTDLAVAIQTVGESLSTEVKVSFTPEKGTAAYAYAIGLPGDAESFEDGTIPGYTSITNGEPMEVTFPDLEPGTVYTVFARAYNEEGEKFAPSELSVRTYTANFMVTEYYVTDISAGFQVKTSADYYKYVYYLGKPGDLEAFRNDETESKTADEVYNFTYNYWTLEPDTEYTFFVKGWDRQDNETKIFALDFKTEPMGSDAIPNVTFTPGRADFYMQEYTVTPNAKCKQIVLRQSAKGYNDGVINFKYGYAGDVMRMFDAWKDVDIEIMRCYTAKDKVLVAQPKTEEKTLDNELDIYVLIYDENYKLSSAKKFANKTPSKNESASIDDMKVEITMTKTSQDGVAFDIFTNEATRGYIFDIYADADYKKAIANGFDPMTTFQDQMLVSKSTQFGYDLREEGYTNNEIVYKLGATYHVVVCPVNENGPFAGGVGEVVIEHFTITE